MKYYILLYLVLLFAVGCGGVGEKIAYVSTMDAIYVIDADGSNPTRVITDKNLGSAPCWSNDNSRLAYLSNNEDELYVHLVIVDIDGANKTTLDISSLPFDGYVPISIYDNYIFGVFLAPRCWHPTEDKILLVVGGENGVPNLYQVTIDGTEAKLLTNKNVGNMSGYSPQGDKIASSGWNNGTIFDSQGNTLLANYLDSDGGQCMSWSSDGSSLLCSLENYIFTINADGTERTIIMEGEESVYLLYPNWSHDESRILYSAQEDSGDCAIYTINADGTEKSKLLEKLNTCAGSYSTK